MSAKFLGWALDVMFKQSSLKNMLTITANLANHETHEVYGSLQYYQDATGLSKKTVISCLQQLEDMKILTRTGEMKGKTGQIPVYIFDIVEGIPTVPKGKGVKLHRLENDDVKEGRFCLERGSFLPRKEGQKRHTEPSTRNQEEKHNPSLPTEEPPLEGELDLLGDIVPADEGPLVLLDYVKTQWAELSCDYPRIANPRVWSEGRRKKIRARAFEVVRESGHEVTAVQVWDQIFAAIRGSEWLRGEAAPGKGYSESFVIDLDRLLQQNMFFKILERAPVDAERNRTIPTVNGRQLGPADQAAYRAIERQLARRKLKRGGGDQSGRAEDQPRDR